ncbi:MAG: alanine racemase [Phaeodactylibacter sp.]|uniref:alanine racemase n=1 Tax=Phaeodactylibacter sp. TaxID=1940289 RepID=UPI0032EF182F
MFDDITTPTLLLNEAVCRRNIHRMAEKARQLGIRLRPHMKTPQSIEVARWLRDYGLNAITVSSFRMAEYFAADGWEDITVAFPVNIREMEAIKSLSERIRLNITVENLEGARALQDQLSQRVRVWAKVNIGNNRTGLPPEDTARLDALLDYFAQADKLRFSGFLGHAGQSYADRGVAAIAQTHQSSLAAMQTLRDRYQGRFPQLEISVGDTPTASVMDSFPGVDEIRPGNFLFYDLMQWQIGACTPADIAVAMACPVVAKHPDRHEIVLYGGAVHFSKDFLTFSDDKPFYGLAAKWGEGGWELLQPGAYLRKLSQEHGLLRVTEDLFGKIDVGTLIMILPIHSCLTANLMKAYRLMDGKRIGMMP